MGDHALETNETQYRNFWERILNMKPLMLRAVLVAVAGILAQVFGYTVVEDALIDLLLDGFTSISAVVLYIWGKDTVTANSKVIVMKPDPTKHEIISGRAAVTTPEELDAVVEAATYKAA